MEPLNQSLFLLINASHQPNVALLGLTKFLAQVPVFFALLCLVLMWLKDNLSKSVVLNAIYVTSFALLVNFVISLMWQHNRPFVDHIGLTFIRHTPDSSFPSDHVTFLACIAFCLSLDKHYHSLGICLLGLSLATAWARVFSGVHYPFDVLGAYALSALWCGLFEYYCARRVKPFNHIVLQKLRAISQRIFHFH